MLSTGAGIVVDHRNPYALSAAIRTIIEDSTLALSMSVAARRIAPGLSWDAVAQSYVELVRELEQDTSVPVNA
jgi:glycosyltransferase involved in cell wall biosynthesis